MQVGGDGKSWATRVLGAGLGKSRQVGGDGKSWPTRVLGVCFENSHHSPNIALAAEGFLLSLYSNYPYLSGFAVAAYLPRLA